MLTTPNLDSGAWVAGKESDLSPIAVRCVRIIRAVKRCVPVAIDFGRNDGIGTGADVQRLRGLESAIAVAQ